MLTVVEDQQRALTRKVFAQHVDDGPTAFLANAERRRNRQRNALGVEKRRQIDVPHAVRKGRKNPFRELDREPRFAASADARQCEKPRLVEQRRVLVEIVVMTDETGQLLRQIVSQCRK